MFSHFVVFLASLGLSKNQFAHAEPYDPSSHRAWNFVNGEKCGLQHPQQRVFGGENAVLGELPWVVQIIMFLGFPIVDSRMRCGGAIINKKFVLTVAHCKPSGKLSGKIKAGDLNRDYDPDCDSNNLCAPVVQEYDIEEFIVHPEHINPELGKDIALVKIRDEFQFNDFVAPICLEYGDMVLEDHTGKDAIFAGWGKFRIDPVTSMLESPAVLQKITLPIRDENECNVSLSNITNPAVRDLQQVETLICAGGFPDQHIYHGDSGGSLAVLQVVGDDIPRYFAVGLCSLTFPDVPRDTPVADIFTRVSYYLRWIMDTIAQENGI
uniref:Easter-11 n=1 Tax=Nilaparvata lugens TaxID=108931 RepID=A0A068F764_NILLU|nr:easter-11 [Nilaparvata lugens]APA33881.1 seminal fluid protein [Nilaparvata lugens]